MANDSITLPPPAKPRVNAAEWQARVDLAALYRLVALHGWDDMIFTHLSARVPGPEQHFLINPYGLFFEEMTASALVKVDQNGVAVEETHYSVNPAGFIIHSAVHAARQDAHFVMHLHSDQGVAVAAQAEGLLPLTQHALAILPGLAYHAYEGVALNADERARLVADLGDKMALLLRNHGTLTVGATAAEAWLWMFFLERACKQQVMALSAGRAGVQAVPDAVEQVVESQMAGGAFFRRLSALAWPGLLRKLDRHLPGYAA